MLPHDILKQYWGFDTFRPLQEDIVTAALNGHDVLALLPTGGGKSLCFQVPALCKEGICIVVSPLIALMKDQVQNLNKRGISAVAVYAGMHYKEIDRILENCVYGAVKFLYLSPERLQTEIVQERIKKMKVSFLAVDEAHCISQWGYDFRPPYLEISQFRIWKPDVPFIALTATATPPVVKDIQTKLAFRKDAKVFRKSFARDNLAYVVLHEEAKENKMLDILQKVKGSSVVYVRNRRRTKDIADFLVKRGISADYYHAGLGEKERSTRQDNWINGKTRVIVATNAFGMGIDKPDVRSVIHIDVPDSLEAYFQEAGRAGRDGKKAYTALLWNGEGDKKTLLEQYEQSYPEPEEIRQTYRALGSYYQLAVGGGLGDTFEFDILNFSTVFKLNAARTYSALKILQQSGWIELTEAVHESAQLQVISTKEQLYDYLLKNSRFEKLLKAILRSSEGAYSHLVAIKEQKLASFLNISLEVLKSHFQQLAKDGIIMYVPEKEKPQIIFTRDRVVTDNLEIDKNLYDFRKQRQEERLKAVFHYVETIKDCRSATLSAYFGETDAPACGKCDVCLGRHKNIESSEEQTYFTNKILSALKEESPLYMSKIIADFPGQHEQKVIEVLSYLADNGFVEINGENEVRLS